MRKFIPLLLLLTLTSCKTIYSRGQYVDDAQVDSLMNKKMTKEEITEMLGSPTLVSDYSKDTWYYAQRNLLQRAWLKPKVVSQRVVQIDFAKNVTSKVEVFNDADIKDIVVASEYTKSPGTEKNALQSFVRNFAKFNKAKKKKKTR